MRRMEKSFLFFVLGLVVFIAGSTMLNPVEESSVAYAKICKEIMPTEKCVDTIGSKATSISVIYGVITVVALFLLVAYCVSIHKKELWFLLLFSSVFIVNIGYFTLSISKTLEEALLANRIAYFGSVFLPMSMLMIILRVCKLRYKKWIPCLLLSLSTFVFLVAASPGYYDIYYKKVALQKTVNGVSILDKTYGEWHCLYLYYLCFYFGVMVVTIIQASVKKKIESNLYAVILVGAVFVNIGIWLLEQFVKLDFEILSVSYIITEFFMLGLSLVLQEHGKKLTETKKIVSEDKEFHMITDEDKVALADLGDTKEKAESEDVLNQEHIQEQDNNLQQNDNLQQDANLVLTEQQKHFLSYIHKLTPTENTIYHYYLEGKSTKEIRKELNITENTLKYHNKNIYSKLGVSSRKQLVEIATELNLQKCR